MSVDITMAVLYAQSGLSNNANAAMVAPQASLAVTRMLAAESMRQERQQVAKQEKADQTSLHKDGGGSQKNFMTRRRTQRPAQKESEQILAKSPTVGNLLNVKV